ncbi:MAG: nitrite/sulfite reductase [Deltaproteobacteria bacterium]|nr:nitrite/sulfite reductase [Deltaproteobacteria bacterium]
MTARPEANDSRSRESFGDAAESAEFVEMLEKFERGELTSDQYRHYRLSRGIYGQRQDGVQMVRVKIPQGVLSAEQLVVLADCADKYSRGFGHVTTRQNFQFHFVKTEHAPAFMEAVSRSGLTTREACSHTVRNVAGCPYAGVCSGAAFDVTPYGEMVTRHFLRRPYGSGLPRKFKIAISGCDDDCAQGAMNDIGIIGRVREGVRGFKIVAGGGTSTLPRNAGVLHEFLPAEELLASCEAIARVFNAEGERGNLQKARMKWAIKRLGWEKFQALYEEQLELIRKEGGRPLPVEATDEQPPNKAPLPRVERPMPTRFTDWKRAHARPQRQEGYCAVAVWLRLGDVSSRQLRALADIVAKYGDATLRTTNDQNLLIRWIREQDLPALWLDLDAVGLGEPHAGSTSDVVSCPGAETCRIAVTASRGVAQLVGDRLREKHGALRREGLDIKVSGCPNGCGQHHVSAIGLQGGTRHVGTKLVPQYFVMIGGGIDVRGATFGRLVGKVPARRVPEAIDRLIAHFDANRTPGETARAYFQRLEIPVAKQLLADLIELKEADAKPDDFIDLGSNVEFQVVDMDGECAQ